MKQRRNNRIKNLYVLYRKLIFDGFIIGFVSGIFSIFYRFLISELIGIRILLLKKFNFVLIALLFIMVGLIIGKLIKWDPLSSGSGISQVKSELIGKVNMNSERLITSKIVGGGLSNFVGLSLGRAGPSIQIGAAASKKISRLMKKDKIEEKHMIMGGASAGLAATFNAPISGTIFALEKLHGKFSILVLIPCAISSIVADLLSKNIFGFKPVFSFKIIQQIPIGRYYNLLFLGIFAGIIGWLFNKTVTLVQNIFNGIKINVYLKITITVLVAIALAYSSYELLGGGDKLLENLSITRFPIKMLIVLVLGKLLFTAISYASGAQGGLFLPILVLGGLVGAICFNISNYIIAISDAYYITFLVCGMAAIMAVFLKSPIFATVLVSEMTGSFRYVLILFIVSIIAYIVSGLLSRKLPEVFVENY